jgi:hypothetical protein
MAAALLELRCLLVAIPDNHRLPGGGRAGLSR